MLSSALSGPRAELTHTRSGTLFGALSVSLCAVLGLTTGCSGGGPGSGTTGGGGSGPDAGSLPQDTRPKVLVAPVQQREMVRRISTTTVVESEREIQLFPRVGGQVVALGCEEGDRVREGQTLVTLDPRLSAAALKEAQIALREAEDGQRALEFAIAEAEAREARARLTLEQAQRELERKEAIAGGLLSRNELEQLRLTRDQNNSDLDAQNTSVASAKAQLTSQDIAIARAALMVEKAELDLSFTEITAPFDGIVAQRMVKVGDLVSTSAAVLTLTDPDRVRAIVYRPQRELTFFRSAERARSDEGATAIEIVAHPEALQGTSFAGAIQIVSPTVDPTSGQFRVTVALEQTTAPGVARLLPGMLVRLEIVTERHPDALVVPKRAVVREGEAYFVFVADGGVVRRVRVNEGFADDLDLEILPTTPTGLARGATVVVVGNRDLEDGDRVDAEPWKDVRKGLLEEPEPDAETAPLSDTAKDALVVNPAENPAENPVDHAAQTTTAEGDDNAKPTKNAESAGANAQAGGGNKGQ